MILDFLVSSELSSSELSSSESDSDSEVVFGGLLLEAIFVVFWGWGFFSIIMTAGLKAMFLSIISS